jgi:golgi phosphoprotein 3
MLSISEELFLLALNEEKGNILSLAKKNLIYGLAGAILAELALLGKICVNEKYRLELLNTAPTGDEILDEVLNEIRSAEKPRKLSYWIAQIGTQPKKLRERLGDRLIAKGVLYQEDRRFFWRSPEDDEAFVPITKFEIKEGLRGMILSTSESNQQDLALLNVVSACDLLNLVFTQDELPIAKRRIRQEVLSIALREPAMQSVEEIERAIANSLDDELD